jgi:hypothetical protein
MSPILKAIYDGASQLIPDGEFRAAASFMPVTGTPGLQAADLVANYFYKFATEWLKDNAHAPDPHLWSLITSGLQIIDGIMGEDEIAEMAAKMRAKNDWLRD